MHAAYRNPKTAGYTGYKSKKHSKYSVFMRVFAVPGSAEKRGDTPGTGGDTSGETKMERNKYLKMCQRASYKTALAGAWWAAKWDAAELVQWRGSAYVPFDYRFGFRAGEVTGVAILHSPKTNSAVEASLKEVEEHL